jgi:cytochrome P450
MCYLIFLFQGVDTSSVTLSWIIYVLGKHPQVQDHILEELNKIIPDFSNQKLTVDIINEFHYLDRVIKEVLRLYPPAPFIGRQIYKPVQIGKKYILIF